MILHIPRHNSINSLRLSLAMLVQPSMAEVSNLCPGLQAFTLEVSFVSVPSLL